MYIVADIEQFCGLPREMWFNILQQFSTSELQLFVPFMKGTCYSLNVIAKQYTATRADYSPAQASLVVDLLAQKGSLSCVKFLAEFGKRLKTTTLDNAAKSGNVELLQYLNGTGLTVSWIAVKNAGISANFDCFKYTLDHVTKEPAYIQPEFYVASVLEGGNLESIKYALQWQVGSGHSRRQKTPDLPAPTRG